MKQRFRGHRHQLHKGKHANIKLQRAWNKYGAVAFRFDVLDYCDEPEELIPCEQQWIDSIKPHYNLRLVAHSNAGIKLSEEVCQRRRKPKPDIPRVRKPRVHSPETRAKMSKVKLGTTRIFTAEHRAKLAAKAKGRIPTTSFLGKKHTEETRAKISAAHKGRPWTDAQRLAHRLGQQTRRSSYREVVTHCPKGHEFTMQNTYFRGNCRECRTCRTESQRKRRAARSQPVQR
jgi:group I intron endonuclease